jgi:hypothetical protein
VTKSGKQCKIGGLIFSQIGVAYRLPYSARANSIIMKKIQAVFLRNEKSISIAGVVLAFVAGCLAATMFWYFVI